MEQKEILKEYRRKVKPCPNMLSDGEIEKIHSDRFAIRLETASLKP
jgi:hypothetical protein